MDSYRSLGYKRSFRKISNSKSITSNRLLRMMGDAVDNIPGLPGVGKKTAKFISKYGSMESLLNTHED